MLGMSVTASGLGAVLERGMRQCGLALKKAAHIAEL